MASSLDLRVQRYAPSARHARHAHGYTNISLVLGGALVERVGREEAWARTLSVVVKPADTEHADAFGPRGASLLQLRVPPEWAGRLGEVHPTRQWRWLQSLPAARWMLRLTCISHADSTGSASADALAECLAAVDGPERARRGEPPAWLARVRERIEDECTSNLRVSDLARDAGVHPVHLTREFRRHFGTSVMERLQVERTRRAADTLACGHDPVSWVAYGAGFADQPHLTRVFRRVLGVTPAAYRRRAEAVQV